MSSPAPVESHGLRAPSLADALIPAVSLIVLIALTIAIFGTAATDGPLQVALLTSAAIAALIALKNGATIERVRTAATAVLPRRWRRSSSCSRSVP
jgi:NhaC family Na+:H+ antiporter